MTARNGASTYRCLGCKGDLGAIRRNDAGVREFVVAPGIRARYREGGVLELSCPCGRVSPVDWRGDRT